MKNRAAEKRKRATRLVGMYFYVYYFQVFGVGLDS